MKGGTNLYLRLKYEIQRKGYSIDMFSNRIGISEKTLRNKINGITDFTWSEVLLIRKLIDPKMKLEELFKKEPKNINVIK